VLRNRPNVREQFELNREDYTMKYVSIALLMSIFAIGSAAAQSCSTQAVSKDGKALAGAAKTSFIKRCCETAAVSKDGKPLAGAAKASFVKKCQAEG